MNTKQKSRGNTPLKVIECSDKSVSTINKHILITDSIIDYYTELYNTLFKDIRNIDFDNIRNSLNGNNFNTYNLELANHELYRNLDVIIKDNYDILYEYRFFNIEYNKTLLNKQHWNLYYRHAIYSPLEELNISPLTRTIMVLKILDIHLIYQVFLTQFMVI